jgi:hypothetical protein
MELLTRKITSWKGTSTPHYGRMVSVEGVLSDTPSVKVYKILSLLWA